MKFVRTLVVCLFIASLVAGCGPKKEDTDPKGDELNLKIDDGEGDADDSADGSKTGD
jgi:hypothetical protein